MRWKPAILVILTALLGASGCMNPQEIEDPGDTPYSNDDLFKESPCSKPGVDTDQDGLTDECENYLGTDPNNKDTDNDGFNDNVDPPPTPTGTPTKKYEKVEESWWQKLLQQIGPSLTAGSSALTGKAPDGTKVDLTVQRFRISNGTPNGDKDPDWAGIKDFCGGENFIYLYVEGRVTYCASQDATVNCTGKEVPAKLKFCKKDPPWQGDPNTTDLSVRNATGLQWDVGEANALRFNPKVLNRKGAASSFDLTVTPTQQSSTWLTKIKTDWTSHWSIRGVCTNDWCKGQYTVQSGEIETNKRWNRFDLNYYSTTTPPPGILGNWANE